MKDLQYKPPVDTGSKPNQQPSASPSTSSSFYYANARSSQEDHHHHYQTHEMSRSSHDHGHNSTSSTSGSSTLFHPTTTSTSTSGGNMSSSGDNTTTHKRPANNRTTSTSSITSITSSRSNRSNTTTTRLPQQQQGTASSSSSSSFHLAGAGAATGNSASSPAASVASSGMSSRAIHEDEIESSLRQWRNHVFPSLKAGNYISPGQETPDRDPIHPLVEPILPSIFANAASSSSSSSSSPTNSSSSNTAKKTAFKTSTNSRAIPFIYENGRQFLDAVIGTSASSSSTTIPASTSTDKLDDKDIGKQQSQEAQATDNKDEEIYKEDQGGDGGYQEDYESNWRLEMVLGQTKDLISINEKSEGIWIALWSGEERTKTRLLEFCLMKLPSRPLVISSPIPIALLPTALLQDRMQTLLNAYLSIPSIKANPSPFDLIMGPSRVIEAFLLHYDTHPGLTTTAGGAGFGHASHAHAHSGQAEGMFEQSVLQLDQSPYPLKLSHPKYTAAMKAAAAAEGNDLKKEDNRTRSGSAGSLTTPAGPLSKSVLASSDVTADSDSNTALSHIRIAAQSSQSTHTHAAHGLHSSGESALSIPALVKAAQPVAHRHQMFHHSAAAGRTVKPLLHTRAKDIPPAVSLSEGFAVRLAAEKDDMRTLVSLFQAYSNTLDHTLEEGAARRAVQKAMSNNSIWIYHIYSQSLPGLSLIAGFLTTERKRPYTGSKASSKKDGGKGKGSVAITAVFAEEAYRSRGVAESLVRTATRYYLVDLEYDYVSVYVDPRNETTCRVFSRVGYGIMDREVKEEIPVKLIRDALHVQWEEEKIKLQFLLDKQDAEEAAAYAANRAHKDSNEDGIEGVITSPGVQSEHDQSIDSNLSASPTTPTLSKSLEAARNALSLLSTANSQLQANTAEHLLQQQQEHSMMPSTSPINAESGSLIPTAEENEATLQAENGKPLCTSAEEWQVVSLKSREVALVESRSRTRGHTRRDDVKRLSSEGPWH